MYLIFRHQVFLFFFCQVCVKAGEILITSHLMDSTTVTKETVPMF